MRRLPFLLAGALGVAALACRGSGPVTAGATQPGPSGATVSGHGGKVPDTPYGLPPPTVVGGDVVRPTPTAIPSNVPPTPVP